VKYILPPVNKLSANQQFLNKLQNMKKDYYWIGFAGRIAREKGLEYLIEAVTQLDNPQKYQLVFAGPEEKNVVGESLYFQHITRLLKTNKIKYLFLGQLHQGKLGAFFKSIDILALTSINQTEAFGMVQVEAMLLGTPVVASDLPGVRVPIQKTGMGIIIPPKDSFAISQAINKIKINHPKHATKEQVKQAQQLFHIENTLKSFDAIIKQISNK
jgi:glycosyltransferase involved in cell wall biosynthesis